MGSHKKRVEHLERREAPGGAAIIVVYGDETNEEAREKHMAQHPEDENADCEMYIKTDLTKEELDNRLARPATGSDNSSSSPDKSVEPLVITK